MINFGTLFSLFFASSISVAATYPVHIDVFVNSKVQRDLKYAVIPVVIPAGYKMAISRFEINLAHALEAPALVGVQAHARLSLRNSQLINVLDVFQGKNSLVLSSKYKNSLYFTRCSAEDEDNIIEVAADLKLSHAKRTGSNIDYSLTGAEVGGIDGVVTTVLVRCQ